VVGAGRGADLQCTEITRPQTDHQLEDLVEGTCHLNKEGYSYSLVMFVKSGLAYPYDHAWDLQFPHCASINVPQITTFAALRRASKDSACKLEDVIRFHFERQALCISSECKNV
jgi:hypothetical protein